MTPPTEAATADLVPAAAPADDNRLMHHSYDGIREYDNPLPGWWRMIFVGSIVFAACYGFYFHVASWGTTPDQKYRAALVEYQGKKSLREAADAANVSEELIARDAKDPTILAHGAEIFASRCVTCHTDNGRGLIGPNLTDLFQIHGTTRMDIYKTVRGGAPGTAMIGWGEQMAATDVLAVAAFVTTLRGTNVPGGKPPQGEPVEMFR